MPQYRAESIGSTAELLVAYRFLEAGRRPAWPLVRCGYDLLVDTEEQVYAVQVKQAHDSGETTRQWRVHLAKRKKGVRQSAPLVSAFDYLCVVCQPNEVYVIPTGALVCTHDPTRVVASLCIYPGAPRFAGFLNRFSLGTGERRETRVLDPLPKQARSMWNSTTARPGQRKAYRRLTLADIAAIRELPIAVTKAEEGPGRIPIAQVAQQFGVHVVTLRNLLRGKRLDLQAATLAVQS